MNIIRPMVIFKLSYLKAQETYQVKEYGIRGKFGIQNLGYKKS
jgi:hypothetical protein